MTTDTQGIRDALRTWFAGAARSLPWRLVGPNGRRDPYRVWVAEILLQQTQVVRGRVYFERFMAAFPTVQDLAGAPEEAVMKAWEGCGYYARARNLQKAARVVTETGLPTDYDGWLALPGVGPYTAAAISSIAYGEARAVLDGNVRRVLARIYAERTPTDTWAQQKADELLDGTDPGAWNEAVMDLGATICVPKAPRCPACPLRAQCAALATGEPGLYPAPKLRSAVKAVQGALLLIGTADHAHLERNGEGLLGGLWSLPSEVAPDGDMAAAAGRLAARLGATDLHPLGGLTHQMTHRAFTYQVYAARADLPLMNTHELALSNLDRKALALLASPQAGLW